MELAAPPPSRVPRVDDGTAVSRESLQAKYTRIPGSAWLSHLPQRLRLDFGPDAGFDSEGLIVRTELTGGTVPVELVWAYGGVTGQRGVRDGDIGTESVPISEYFQLKPEFCRNNTFTLAEDAAMSVLIAGGIGITPIWCMVQRLVALKRPWQLHYAVRGRGAAAFLDELQALVRARVAAADEDRPGDRAAARVRHDPADRVRKRRLPAPGVAGDDDEGAVSERGRRTSARRRIRRHGRHDHGAR